MCFAVNVLNRETNSSVQQRRSMCHQMALFPLKCLTVSKPTGWNTPKPATEENRYYYSSPLSWVPGAPEARAERGPVCSEAVPQAPPAPMIWRILVSPSSSRQSLTQGFLATLAVCIGFWTSQHYILRCIGPNALDNKVSQLYWNAVIRIFKKTWDIVIYVLLFNAVNEKQR